MVHMIGILEDVYGRQKILDENFLICYSDNFVQIRLDKIYEKWIKDSSKYG